MAAKLGLTALILAISSPTVSASLTVAARSTLIEAAPVVIALQDYYNLTVENLNLTSLSYSPASAAVGPALFINGLPDLWEFPETDLDAGAEVHVLHDAPHHPDLRIITTVAEVYHRVVASKSSGITSDPASLRGKRIGVTANSTSEYFAYKYLRDVAGLSEGEYTLVPGSGRARGLCYALPCGNGTLPDLLQRGEIDALTVYEPTTQLAIDTLGESNVVVFRNDSLYRELSVMYTTAAKLENPETRKKIVEFVRILEKVQKTFAEEPEKLWERVSRIIAGSGMSVSSTVDTLERIWGLTKWTGGIPDDMVDILVEEDRWVSKDVTLGPRAAMSRQRIESHVYRGVVEEARGLRPL